MTLASALNPITRTLVEFIPPIEISSTADYNYIMGKFERYCEHAWSQSARNDPRVIRNLREWHEPEEDD